MCCVCMCHVSVCHACACRVCMTRVPCACVPYMSVPYMCQVWCLCHVCVSCMCTMYMCVVHACAVFVPCTCVYAVCVCVCVHPLLRSGGVKLAPLVALAYGYRILASLLALLNSLPKSMLLEPSLLSAAGVRPICLDRSCPSCSLSQLLAWASV